jgi:glutaminyl-tRNA synthetase
VEDPLADDSKDFLGFLNPDSVKLVSAYAEPSVSELAPGAHVQFERMGYFFADPDESKAHEPVFNRTATLRDSWAKVSGR